MVTKNEHDLLSKRLGMDVDKFKEMSYAEQLEHFQKFTKTKHSNDISNTKKCKIPKIRMTKYENEKQTYQPQQKNVTQSREQKKIFIANAYTIKQPVKRQKNPERTR